MSQYFFSLRATSRFRSELCLGLAPSYVSFTLRARSCFLCKVLDMDLVRASPTAAGLGNGGRFGRFACGRLVAWNGGAPVLMEGFGWYRWNWDPGGCLELKCWSWTNISLVWWMRASLVAGGYAAITKRRCTVPCPPYLLRELGGYWAWAFDPYGLMSYVFISSFICCFRCCLFICIINYPWMWHNGLSVYWCAGCAWFTRSSEGVLFLCFFTWNGGALSVAKLDSPYTTLKQTFARWWIFVPKWGVFRLFTQSRSARLLDVLLGVLEPWCILPGRRSFLFKLVCLAVCLVFVTFCAPAWVCLLPYVGLYRVSRFVVILG